MDADQLRALAPVIRRALLDHCVNLRELRVADVLVTLSYDEGLASAFIAEQRDLCVVTRLSEGDVSESLEWLKARGIARYHAEESRWEVWADPRDWRPLKPDAEPVRCRHRGAAAQTQAWRTWGRLRRDARTGPRAPWLGAELDPLSDPFGEARMEVSREEALSLSSPLKPVRLEPATVRLPSPAPAGGLSRPPSPDRPVPPSEKVAAASVPVGASSVQRAGDPAPVNKSGSGPASLSESLSEKVRKSLSLSDSLSHRPRASCARASDASDVSDEETSSPSDASDGSGRTGFCPDGRLAAELAEACAETWEQWRGWWALILDHAPGRAAVRETLGELKWRCDARRPPRNPGAWLSYHVRAKLGTGGRALR